MKMKLFTTASEINNAIGSGNRAKLKLTESIRALVDSEQFDVLADASTLAYQFDAKQMEKLTKACGKMDAETLSQYGMKAVITKKDDKEIVEYRRDQTDGKGNLFRNWFKDTSNEGPYRAQVLAQYVKAASDGEVTVKRDRKSGEVTVSKKKGEADSRTTDDTLKAFNDFVAAFRKDPNDENKEALIAQIDIYQKAKKTAK